MNDTMARLHGLGTSQSRALEERRREYEEEREALQPYHHQSSNKSGHNSDCKVKQIYPSACVYICNTIFPDIKEIRMMTINSHVYVASPYLPHQGLNQGVSAGMDTLLYILPLTPGHTNQHHHGQPAWA